MLWVLFMSAYYVETYRPAFPGRGVAVRVLSEREYSIDTLSPGMTSVWHVDHVRTKQEALAVTIERAAGKSVTVSRVF